MKGKFLKCFLVLFAASFLFLGAGVAQAAIDYTSVVQNYLNPVNFNAMDNNGGGASYNVTFNSDAENYDGYTVRYSFDMTSDEEDWIAFDFDSKNTIDLSGDTTKLVYLSLFQYDNKIYSDGTVTFYAYDDVLDGYLAMDIIWGKGEGSGAESFTTAIRKDRLGAVATPIPATVWLLGAGVMAIVGIRRKSVA